MRVPNPTTMASSSAKATYKTNGYATWKSEEESTSLSFLKSWFGSPSPSGSAAKVKEQAKQQRKEQQHHHQGSVPAKQGGDHKRVDSLDIGRRLGQCYAESSKRGSLGTSSGGGRSEHSQLSVATQLSLSTSGKMSRSGHRPKIDHCNRRMPSCGMYKYDEVTRMATPMASGSDAPGDPKSKSKHVVIMED